MPRNQFNPEQWGQSKVFPVGSWQPGKAKVVLNLDAPTHDGVRGGAKVPDVHTLIAGIENDDNTNQSYIMRWQLRVGAGGARTEVLFDATRYTRISMPLETCTLALLADPYDGSVDLPATEITAFAFAGEGFAEASTPGPMYSVRFNLVAVPPQDRVTIPIPRGANRFRVVGNPYDGTSPFTTNFSAQVTAGPTSVRQVINGRDVATPGLDLFGLYTRGEWLPIATGATELFLSTTFGVTAGFVIFGLDL